MVRALIILIAGCLILFPVISTVLNGLDTNVVQGLYNLTTVESLGPAILSIAVFVAMIFGAYKAIRGKKDDTNRR